MKQTKFLLGACLALTLAGCSDEVGITADQLPVSGDEITFGAAAGQFTEPTKRTVYGFVDGEDYSNYKKLAIKWVAGKDQVRVYCPNPSEQQWADYTVMGETASGFYLQRTNENAQGVRWGDDLTQEHKFYSFYPLKTSNGAEISGLQDNSTVRATIPTAQLSGKVTSNKDPYSNRTWYVVEPNMSYAMMVGTGTWTPGNSKNVTLNYKPIVTVLDIYVNGPDVNDAAEVNYTITGVGVRSASQPIVGTFDYDAATDQCTYVTPESGKQDDNWAYVEVAGVDGNGQKLNPGEGMNVKFFLLPQDIKPEELTVYVFLSNGSVLSQPLGTGDGSALAKGEIVKVLTPKVKPAETSNWMSAIGDDVLFASQLSLPGTKHSFTYLNYNSESGTYNYQTGMMKSYQTLDINQQFDMGIRAFNLKLNYANGGMYVYAGGANTRFTLSNLLDDLKEKLDATPSEFVVLTIDFVNGSLRRQEWLNEVCSAIDTWSEGHSRTDNPEDGSTENNDDHDYFRQITAETTVGVMRHGIAVVILMPESVGDDNVDLTYTSPNVNVVTNFGTSVQNTSIWHATMGSGRGQADIAVQNLEQNNSPASSVHAAGLGIYPYFITEKYVKESASLDLIATKQGLVRQLMLQSFQNNNTAGADRVNHLYMNDLTGFCVVNNDNSRGWMTANRETCYSYWLFGTQWDWGQDDNSNLYDYRDVQNFDYVADWIRGEQEGVGQTADFSPTRPEADEPYEGQTSIRITGDHSFMGNGGNNALLASQMNPYAEDQIRRFVNDGRTPLGIVFMSFVGTDEVQFGNYTYNVQGNTLPALIVANNFKFALATQASTQGGN